MPRGCIRAVLEMRRAVLAGVEHPMLLVECNRGRVLLQPETVVWATRLFSPHCYDLDFTVPLG